MKKDKNPERPFREAPLAEIRDELIRNGMGEYADVASAVISGDFASAEKLMAEGVRNGTISIEVPNRQRDSVGLKEIINTDEYKMYNKMYTGDIIADSGLRAELGHCPQRHDAPAPWREPLALRLPDGRRFPLSFDCRHCQMNVFAAEGARRENN